MKLVISKRLLLLLSVVTSLFVTAFNSLNLYAQEPRIIYVNGSVSGGDNDGNGWSNAYSDLQIALANANAGDEIWVATGVYSPGATVTDTFQLLDAVAIYGSFAATETARAQRNWETNPTVLSGDIDGQSNSQHVVTSNGVTNTTRLDGLTITAGQSINHSGAGMRNVNSSPILANVTFSHNKSIRGGGMYNENSNPILTNVIFSNNEALYGAGMYNIDSSPILTDVTFSANSGATLGAGMYNKNSSPALSTVTFTHNQADRLSDEYDPRPTGMGGGMFNAHSSLTLSDVNFSNNFAGYTGGGMHNEHSSLIMRDSIFDSNTTFLDGGGIYNSSSSQARIYNTKFSNNNAYLGGGIYNKSSYLDLSTITFIDNDASQGGGIYNSHSSPSLRAITFFSNNADQGGGIYNANQSDSRLDDITFSNNTAREGGGVYNGSESDQALHDVTFTNNTATLNGGGMYNSKSSRQYLSDGIFSNNSANNGGGMFNEWSSPRLIDIIFSNNSASHNGGGMMNNHSNPILINVHFSENLSSDGGGVFCHYSNPTLVNIAFSANSADSGGGMFNSYSNPKLVNTTFSANLADNGSGMLNSYSHPRIANSIFWSNYDASLENTDNSRPIISYSLIENSGGSGNWNNEYGIDDGNNIDHDPLFISPIRFSDVLTNTIVYLQLLSGSPAINAGNQYSYTSFYDSPGHDDLAGNSRINHREIDMGAYESEHEPPSEYELKFTVTGNGSGSVLSFPAGIDCDKICTGRFDSGQIVTLTATADSDSIFIGWSVKDCSGSENCSIEMDGAKNAAAIFAKRENYNIYLPVLDLLDSTSP